MVIKLSTNTIPPACPVTDTTAITVLEAIVSSSGKIHGICIQIPSHFDNNRHISYIQIIIFNLTCLGVTIHTLEDAVARRPECHVVVARHNGKTFSLRTQNK